METKEGLNKKDKTIIAIGATLGAVMVVGTLAIYSNYLGKALTIIGSEADKLTQAVLEHGLNHK